MYLKEGALIQGLRPEMLLGIWIAAEVFERIHGYEPTMTSGDDGKHSLTSLHNSGCASDFRANDLPAEIAEEIRDAIKARLGEDFDVLLERDPDEPENDHIHIEYQPRRRR